MNFSINDSSGNETLGSFDHLTCYLITFTQCLQDLLAILIWTLFLRLMYKTVEIGHPVFAVIFQEIIVLITVSVVSFLNTALTTDLDIWIVNQDLVGISGLSFHQSSWLIITVLR